METHLASYRASPATQCYLSSDTGECEPPKPKPDRRVPNLPTPEG